ncbi:MAG TPA: ATP-binding protein [Xanthobacteraceae bacterium]|nr:ATP-binding protein [Xanthobacteraceae bacterium]
MQASILHPLCACRTRLRPRLSGRWRRPLGCSIVRSFVELHHGTVRIDSVPGQGTTVVCTFPLAAATARDAAE